MTVVLPVEEIRQLKERRRALILVHNYQRDEVQDVADFVGDSLELSQKAAASKAPVILFCGVFFMAETAKILSPDATVLMPDLHAGCPMADMVTPRQLAEARKTHPNAAVVCYVNSSAEVKALSDVCCTSSNAVKIVNSFPADKPILFIPNRNLGAYVSRVTRRPLILWEGYCPTHQRILDEHVLRLKAEHPRARVVVHPECVAAVLDIADKVASTSGILRYCRETDAPEFIIGTEIGILHRLRKENPGKTFYGVSSFADCPNMKLTTLEKVLWSLEDMVYEVTVPSPVAAAAKRAIDRMLALS